MVVTCLYIFDKNCKIVFFMEDLFRAIYVYKNFHVRENAKIYEYRVFRYFFANEIFYRISEYQRYQKYNAHAQFLL